MTDKKIILKKNEDRRIRSGHLWVFSNEIFSTEGNPANGDIVELFDSKNELLGTGFYNKNSLIAVRLISDDRVEDLKSLFRVKILSAYSLRKQFYPERKSFRLVFSESDFLPGLIIDKYNHTFVLQVYSIGLEKNIELIVEILKEDFNAKNIFSLNEEHFRVIEGLPVENKIYTGSIEDETIDDGIIKYKIDFSTGQKTGFYFDQSDNRFFIQKLCKERSVLDAFCNSGGFGFHAIKSGSRNVTFVDSSASAIESAKSNYELNKLECETDFIRADVFDYLEECVNLSKTFDVVMIDPPAFAKNKKNINQAKKGYEKLNRLALTIINKNGFLITSSCSYHLDEKDFFSIINSASEKSKRQVQLLHFNNASLDHPSLPAMNETTYLKFAVFHVR